MAIKSSGTISLGVDLKNEFGGTAPFSLRDYLRGGSLVNNNHNVDNASIATSGAIKMSQFYGADEDSYSAGLLAASGYFGIKFLDPLSGDQNPWWYKGDIFTQLNDSGVGFGVGVWGLHPQNYFTTLKITGTFATGGAGTRTNTSATARTYSQPGGNYTYWTWYAIDGQGLNEFIPGNTYTMRLIP